MTVTVETLALGSMDGPRVWLVVRRVGGHLDVEQIPDSVHRERDAHAWAAKRWNVPECDVKFTPVQLVEISDA